MTVGAWCLSLRNQSAGKGRELLPHWEDWPETSLKKQLKVPAAGGTWELRCVAGAVGS